MRTALVALGIAFSTAAHAESYEEPAPATPITGPATGAPPDEPLPVVVARPRSQLQADLGLTVIMLGYERPVGERISLQLEVGIMGTYFLPWFDLGDDVKGVGAGFRAAWFARDQQRGLYVAPYLRVAVITGEHEEAGTINEGKGGLVTAGAFAGYAFRLTDKLDLRLGLGAQYIYIDSRELSGSTPFIAFDAVVGYRL